MLLDNGEALEEKPIYMKDLLFRNEGKQEYYQLCKNIS